MQVHFMAIGGRVMHLLAPCPSEKGYSVTGSDDEIFEPALSKLRQDGLSAGNGWYREKIPKESDAVIPGMHVQTDNPDLQQIRRRGYIPATRSGANAFLIPTTRKLKPDSAGRICRCLTRRTN